MNVIANETADLSTFLVQEKRVKQLKKMFTQNTFKEKLLPTTNNSQARLLSSML